jgi:predicted N-acetyltransferase YhbS
MKIRTLKPGDIKAAAKIVGQNYNKTYERLARRELVGMFKNMMLGPSYLVVEEKGQVIGLAGYVNDWIDYNVYGIFWVNVAPSHQKRGIGRALIKKLITIISKTQARIIILTTQAPKFYRQFGFKTLTTFVSKSKISRDQKSHFMVLALK